MQKTQTHFVLQKGRFIVKLAETYEEFTEALKLRFRVFNLELNEGLWSSYASGMDRDIYDDFCDHLVVIDVDHNRVVGTYRILPGAIAEAGNGYYSENEFDMEAIHSIPGEKLEIGRSCVDKDYRCTNVISLLWAGIARYIEMNGIKHVFGCGSLHTAEPDEINMIYSYLNEYHRAEAEFTVYPFKKPEGLSLSTITDKKVAYEKMPALIKGYLRVGAFICGEPAFDPVFGTTDLFIMLQTDKLLARYRGRFFSELAEPLCASY